jgi:hypothetical protein
MNTNRAEHTATILPSGKILIAGGAAGHPIAELELLDPPFGGFLLSGILNIARSAHTATLMTNGAVLIAGGNVGGFAPSTTAEIYYPPRAGFNLLSGLAIGANSISLNYVGTSGLKYALEYTANLSNAIWISLLTNTAGLNGQVTFTNTPNPTTNNFWRVRAVP